MGITIFLQLFFCFFFILQSPILAVKKSYVVHLERHSHLSEPSALEIDGITDSHHQILASCMTSKEKAKEAIFYSYTRYFNGFAAILEDEEVALLSKHPKVVSVLKNGVKKLQTTKSWEYLGLEKNGEIPANSLWAKAKFGQDIIIATLDTGVWPESESFNDNGMGSIPSRWKGRCQTNDGVRCNRKLIGARYFNKGYEAAIGHKLDSSFQTARDDNGHGTHTLSTAGGGFVRGANFLGSSYGTAKGGAPKARVASYKVCWRGCHDADILAAFEAAISDGVDILSVSLGGSPQEYHSDPVAIGSYHAVENGILVVCAGGNEGPTPETVSNLAPWILTVAASSIDRDFPSTVVLGNKIHFKGKSFKTNTLPIGKYYPLVYSVQAKAANISGENAKFCHLGSLNPKKVKGKIVYCVRDSHSDVQKSYWIAKAGGVGMIVGMHGLGSEVRAEAYFVATSMVSAQDGLSILSYIHNTKSPKAYISGSTILGTVTAPIMAEFSSPGPNFITPQILKPDITAPGVSILAAYTEAKSSFPLFTHEFHVPFNIISGTSMSCPHISGIAALLKALHPRWSPAAIKSAIMTTARTRSNVRQPIANASLVAADPFNYGSGHVWPNRAANPGLVYDLTSSDYSNFLCSIGYNSTKLRSLFVKRSTRCPSRKTSPSNLNYPSINIPSLSGKVTLSRTLKNVGNPSSYKVKVKQPKGILVKVEPETLKFDKLNEEKMFKVIIQGKRGNRAEDEYVFGSLTWTDGQHYVKSPIVVKKASNVET
ncbi:subtilisin-like protease SBT5.3 [Mercurialis annua]|uniref:subtilisin-like protease SBT5.3 n=1 Tax=Mercurialis annua TaxID=3986 RepID=UPI0021603AC7|nr:subtilisin-like protease SBT5.3 [Mercurialis annua]